jgi:hypothetical protein
MRLFAPFGGTIDRAEYPCELAFSTIPHTLRLFAKSLPAFLCGLPFDRVNYSFILLSSLDTGATKTSSRHFTSGTLTQSSIDVVF